MAENDLNAHPIEGEADGWGEHMLENDEEEKGLLYSFLLFNGSNILKTGENLAEDYGLKVGGLSVRSGRDSILARAVG